MPALAYFITFSTYGARLHGDERGSVDRNHNIAGAPLLPADAELQRNRNALMTDPEYRLENPERETVVASVLQHAEFRGWSLLAVHVRTTHVHIVVRGDTTPERMMTEFKAYATRALDRQAGGAKRKHWARHGSTRWLNTEESVRCTIEYTVDEQGGRMAVYQANVTDEPRPQGSG